MLNNSLSEIPLNWPTFINFPWFLIHLGDNKSCFEFADPTFILLHEIIIFLYVIIN